MSAVLVTGGAAGIGAACVRRFAAAGRHVLVLDRSDDVASLVAECAGLGGRVDAVVGDVSDAAAWDECGSVLRRASQQVSVLVCNAVAKQVSALERTSRESWDRQLGVALTGTFLGVQACAEDLRSTGGSVVVVSSVHALVGLPGHAPYAAAKGAQLALTRQLAVEMGPAVRVNAVVPGPILTGMWDGVDEGARARSVEATVLGRFGRPDEVAAVVHFLASADASFVTGATVVVDGGWSITKDSA